MASKIQKAIMHGGSRRWAGTVSRCKLMDVLLSALMELLTELGSNMYYDYNKIRFGAVDFVLRT